jgi:hypothetical protein
MRVGELQDVAACWLYWGCERIPNVNAGSSGPVEDALSMNTARADHRRFMAFTNSLVACVYQRLLSKGPTFAIADDEA